MGMKLNLFNGKHWRLTLGIVLVIVSIVAYVLVAYLSRDTSTVLFYIGIDFAFLPIDICIVILIFEAILEKKEKENLHDKLYLVIGAFYTEIGDSLLTSISHITQDRNKIAKVLDLNEKWSHDDFEKASKEIMLIVNNLDDVPEEYYFNYLVDLKDLLLGKRDFLLRLFENPIFFEHEAFSDLMLAVLHMTEELKARDSLVDVSIPDYLHLLNDIKRAYILLIKEWLIYLEHLSVEYPYMFFLSVRKNPFNDECTVEVLD